MGLQHLLDTGDAALLDLMENPAVGMYCQCPSGFGGGQCEVPSNQCGDHFCFHGGTCIKTQTSGLTVHACDCTTANGEYGGKYCEAKASDLCEADDQNGELYCVNGGTCNPDGA